MLRGGKSYLSARPAFSTDGKRLLVCTGTAVSILRTSAGLLVVPSAMGQPVKGTQENDSNAAHVFAYLSAENTQVQENTPKPLHGQIRKCNLTEPRLAGDSKTRGYNYQSPRKILRHPEQAEASYMESPCCGLETHAGHREKEVLAQNWISSSMFD